MPDSPPDLLPLPASAGVASSPPSPATENYTPRTLNSRPPATPATPTSLVTPESSSHVGCKTPTNHDVCPCDAGQEFRHSHWHRQRDAVYRSLHRTGQTESRCLAFGGCGSFATVERATIGPEDYRIKASHCHDRFCLPCAATRSARIGQDIGRLAQGKEIRFLTLTLRGLAGETLRARLDRLYDCFRQLRRLALWTDAVDGGVAVCEVKRSDSRRWHVHIHALIEGRFLDQGRLSKAWYAITGDSFRVDVRKVTDFEGSVKEVSKYAGKPLDAGFWTQPCLLDECVEALKGRRLVTTFGTWYNAADDLDADPLIEEDDGTGQRWEGIGSLEAVWIAAMKGDAAMSRIVSFLRVRDPLTGDRPRPPPGDARSQSYFADPRR